MKKLYALLLLFFSAMTVLIIPASADDFDNANFTGVNFDWHSGGPAVAPSESAGGHYLIIYSSASTWYTGDTEYMRYYSLSDDVSSIRLVISDGGCTNIQTVPQNGVGTSFSRVVGYRYSSSDSYTILIDSESSVSRVSLDYGSSQSKRVCVITNIPCYDQNGNQLGNNDFLTNFSLQYFMDGSGVFHHYVGTSSTIPGNNSFNVDWYVIPRDYVTPGGSVSDTFTLHDLSTEYVEQNITVWQQFTRGFYAFQEKIKQVGSLGTYEPQYLYYTVPVTTVTSSTSNNTFDINDYSPFLQLKSDTLTTHVTQSFCELDMQDYRYKLGLGGIYNYSDIAVIAVVHDNANNKYRILRHDFNVNSCLACIDSIKTRNDTSQVSAPAPSNVNDWQSLAEYLHSLANNYNTNNIIDYNNFLNNLTAFPWANVVGNGVANGMFDFLPSLSGELDTIFSGLFDDYYVPDLSDIEAQVDADEQAFSDKFQWVKDIKDEISFIITTPLQDEYGEFTFTTDLDKWGVGEITIFDSEWISSDVRGTMKIVIITFCTIALLFYIFKTLPSTLGNMPSD